MSLAFGASFDILHNVSDELWPPVLSGHKLCCPFDPWMSIYGRCVVSFDDGTLVVESTGDHSSPFFIPGSLYLFESVGVYPGFEDVFILLVYRILGVRIFLGQYLHQLWGLLYRVSSDKQFVR